MSTGAGWRATYINSIAQTLTGWSAEKAAGDLLDNCFQVIDEAAIEDVAAPISDSGGQVSGAVMMFRDASAARALSSGALCLTQHDYLTDLPTRAVFSLRLTEAIVVAKHRREKLSVLLVDLDRFRYIYDSSGHSTGDRLLQSVAQRLRASVRVGDVVSRHGGNEFAILIAPVVYAQDMVIAERVLLAQREPYRIDRHELNTTASIGVVTYPDDGNDAETLLNHADLALHHAKESGRDNHQFFTPEMGRCALVRQSLESQLRHALEHGLFELHYQPIVDLQTGMPVGVEAHLRCRHPRQGLVSPAQFISVAEESGLIVQMGRWVLHEACRWARTWNDSGMMRMRVAINVSTAELRATNFVREVWNVLRESGLEPDCLEIELTETFLLQDEHLAASVLQDLKALGVQLSLDDFGTGYSSLSHLKCFPIDTLKIDQSFVRGLRTNATDVSIVSALITMGQNLHKRVVAEGVETAEQLLFLQERSCAFGQGFLFSPPLGASAISRWVQAQANSRGSTPWNQRDRSMSCTRKSQTADG